MKNKKLVLGILEQAIAWQREEAWRYFDSDKANAKWALQRDRLISIFNTLSQEKEIEDHVEH